MVSLSLLPRPSRVRGLVFVAFEGLDQQLLLFRGELLAQLEVAGDDLVPEALAFLSLLVEAVMQVFVLLLGGAVVFDGGFLFAVGVADLLLQADDGLGVFLAGGLLAFEFVDGLVPLGGQVAGIPVLLVEAGVGGLEFFLEVLDPFLQGGQLDAVVAGGSAEEVVVALMLFSMTARSSWQKAAAK